MIKKSNQVNFREDHQIQNLKIQLQSCGIRYSLLEQQHLSTLETLDRVNENRRKERDVELLEKKNLERRLSKMKESMADLEREYDELRESVLELVKKVEFTHGNLSQWPCGTIKLSNAVDPLVPSPSNPSIPNGRNSYVGAILRSLRDTLRLESDAHAQTRAKVRTLEAHIALRDAELETRAHRRQQSSLPRDQEAPQPAPATTDLDTSQITSLLEQALANNKVLEMEIRNLTDKLDTVRSEVGSRIALASFSNVPPSSSVSRQMLTQGDSCVERSISNSPDADGQEGGIATEFKEQLNDLAAEIDALTTEREVLSRAMGSEPASSPKASADSDQVSIEPVDLESNQDTFVAYPGFVPADAPPIPDTLFQQFGEQINRLAAEIEDFKSEREKMLRVAREHHFSTSFETDPCQSSSVITEVRPSKLPTDAGAASNFPQLSLLPLSTSTVDQLEHHIRKLGEQIDAFKEERDAITYMVQTELPMISVEDSFHREDPKTSHAIVEYLSPMPISEPLPPSGDTISSPKSILVSEVQSKRGQSHRCFSDAQVQTEPWPTIQWTLPQLQTFSPVDPTSAQSPPALIEFDDDVTQHVPLRESNSSTHDTASDGEISMELATPLVPSAELQVVPDSNNGEIQP